MSHAPWGHHREPQLLPAHHVVLHLDNVGVSIDGTDILHHVSLDVRTGEVLALVGPNGAGKSTLLAAITGDAPLSYGAISLFDVPMGAWDPVELAMRRAVLLQSNDVSFPFTAEQVVRMGRSPWEGTSVEQDDDLIVDHAMAMTETTEFESRTYTSLSGGERARAAFARVLAQSSTVLLLDEPTAAMDIKHQELVMRLAHDYARYGCAVVVVVHALDLAAAYADQVALLESGRIREIGRPREVLTETLLSDVYQYPIERIDRPDGGMVIVPIRHHDAKESS